VASKRGQKITDWEKLIKDAIDEEEEIFYVVGQTSSVLYWW
jgi:hypothetical protein